MQIWGFLSTIDLLRHAAWGCGGAPAGRQRARPAKHGQPGACHAKAPNENQGPLARFVLRAKRTPHLGDLDQLLQRVSKKSG